MRRAVRTGRDWHVVPSTPGVGLFLAELGKIGDTRASRPIMEFLHRDLDPATRGTAIFALGDIGSPETVDALSQIAQADGDQTLRRIAGDALNKVQAHQAVMKKE